MKIVNLKYLSLNKYQPKLTNNKNKPKSKNDVNIERTQYFKKKKNWNNGEILNWSKIEVKNSSRNNSKSITIYEIYDLHKKKKLCVKNY